MPDGGLGAMSELERVAEALIRSDQEAVGFHHDIKLANTTEAMREKYLRLAEAAVAALSPDRIMPADPRPSPTPGRLMQLLEWIERDRRESDKVLMYVQEARGLGLARPLPAAGLSEEQVRDELLKVQDRWVATYGIGATSDWLVREFDAVLARLASAPNREASDGTG